MTRNDAIERLCKPALSDDLVKKEFEYIANKLEISVLELQGYFEAPNKSYLDYKNQQAFFNLGATLLKKMGIEKSIKR